MPESGRKGGVGEEGTDDVIDGTNFSFGFPILG